MRMYVGYTVPVWITSGMMPVLEVFQACSWRRVLGRLVVIPVTLKNIAVVVLRGAVVNVIASNTHVTPDAPPDAQVQQVLAGGVVDW